MPCCCINICCCCCCCCCCRRTDSCDGVLGKLGFTLLLPPLLLLLLAVTEGGLELEVVAEEEEVGGGKVGGTVPGVPAGLVMAMLPWLAGWDTMVGVCGVVGMEEEEVEEEGMDEGFWRAW